MMTATYSTLITVTGWWVALNCTAGPVLVWFFFRRKRRAREARLRWIAFHPTTPWDKMPLELSGMPTPHALPDRAPVSKA
jgi:hypothetical protein